METIQKIVSKTLQINKKQKKSQRIYMESHPHELLQKTLQKTLLQFLWNVSIEFFDMGENAHLICLQKYLLPSLKNKKIFLN